MNALHELISHGQSYWLDNLTRDMIRDGGLQRRVVEGGLRGVTSNPAIFHKAITKGHHRPGRSCARSSRRSSVGSRRVSCRIAASTWRLESG